MASGTEIAKAYVQIIPTTKGIKDKLKKPLSEEADKAGRSSGQSLGQKLVGSMSSVISGANIGGIFKTLGGAVSSVAGTLGSGLAIAAKTAGAGLAVTTAGVAALSKQALDAYADFEQLTGGVETLFGDSANTVKYYAAVAYQSAGVSANKYMETVTSFSASLLQSLGNDTAAAAEYANTAMVDMADNANKMGTSMQDIQNAYQGFAKQNYTMLDNLKLGYGGTQSEMKRLIEDAEKLDSSFSATRDSNGELTMSFADIVDAIHIVQTEMGITGTTAEEASTTIQGSVASMKAAWSNLLVAVADDSIDFDYFMNAFVESVGTAASNILPRVQVILGGVGQLVTELAPIIAETIPTLVDTVLPSMLEAAVALMEALVNALVSAAPTMVTAAVTIIQSLTDCIVENGPMLLTGADQIIQAIANGIVTLAPSLVSAGISIVTSIAGAISANGPALVQAAMNGIYAVLTDAIGVSRSTANGIMSVLQSLLNGCQTIWDSLTAALGTVSDAFHDAGVDWGSVCTDVGDVVSQVAEIISLAIQAVGEIVSWLVTEVNTQGTLLNAAWESIKAVFSGALDVIQGLLTAFVALFQGDWETFGQGLVDAGTAFLSTLATTFENAWSAIFQLFGTILGPVVEDTKSNLENIQLASAQIWGEITTDLGTKLETIKTNASAAWEAVKTNASASWDSIKTDLGTKWESIKTNASTTWTNIKTNASTTWSGIKATLSGDTSAINIDTLAKFEALKTGISSKLTSARDTIASIFTSIKTGIENKINAAKTAVQDAIEAIKEKFNFTWSLPHLSLPHVSISGHFSLDPPSVPSFSVSWYRKAMGSAMILDGATIFGLAGGNLLGGGEAGREVVSGEDHLLDLMRSTVGGELETGTRALEEKVDRLIALLAGLTGITININGTDYRSKRELAEAIMERLELERSRLEARYGY